jgi:hypothetical protein
VPDDVWSSFAAAGFTCWCPEPITVRPAPPGATSGPHPFAEPVAFLTADNPQGRVVPEADNLVRRAALADALDALGASWLPAVGGDPDGDHLEPGAAVPGMDLATATGLSAQFDQAAVYLWTPLALHLVACAGDRHEVLGWTAATGVTGRPPLSLRRR